MFFFFCENKVYCLADYLHEMLSFIFSEKEKKISENVVLIRLSLWRLIRFDSEDSADLSHCWVSIYDRM